MKERPIIFKDAMIRAILDGRKTQTRRITKPQPELGKSFRNWIVDPKEMDIPRSYCPYGIPGDRLWVKENYTWVTLSENDPWEKRFSQLRYVPTEYKHDQAGCKVGMLYRATDTDWENQASWTSSRFMPHWASRILLEITSIKVEQLQEISGEDAIQEGWPRHLELFPDINAEDRPILWFRKLWNSLNSNRCFGWDVNPWVWVIKFRRIV